MKYLILFAVPFAAFFFQSCTVQESVRVNRGVSAMDYPQTHVRKAEGTCKKSRLGKPNSRVRTKTEAAARRDMMENNPLGDNQAYANIRVEAESTGYFFFRVHRARASAEIVEVSAESED